MPPRRPLALDEDIYQQVLAEAHREGRLPTAMLRRLVAEALKERARRRKPKTPRTPAAPIYGHPDNIL